MNCDAQSLTDAAKCIECGVPPGMQLPVLISLLCQIVNNGGGGGPCPPCDWVWTPAATNFWETYQIGPGVDGNIFNTVTFNGTALHDYNNGLNGGPNGITSLNMPNCLKIGNGVDNGNFISGGALSMTQFLIPVLQTVDGTLDLSFNNLLAFSAPALTDVNFNATGGTFSLAGNANLTTVSIPVLLFGSNMNIDISGCALNVTSVNHILRRCVISGSINGVLELAGGSSAAPTGQGLLDKATLVTRGWTVNTN